MAIELSDYLGRVYVSINYDHLNKWVICTWLGEQTSTSVLLGASACIPLLQEHACGFLLNDNRQISGLWSDEVLEGLVASWAPRAIQAGLTHMATVVHPDSLVAIYEEALQLDLADRLHMRHFYHLLSAQQWLLASRASQ